MTLKKNRSIEQHKHYFRVSQNSSKYYEYVYRDNDHIRRLRTTHYVFDGAIILSQRSVQEYYKNRITFVLCADIRNSKYKFYCDLDTGVMYASLRVKRGIL